MFFYKSLVLILWVKYFLQSRSDNYKSSLVFLKKKSFTFSYAKAPMAHKTNSHEHYSITLNRYQLFFKILNRFLCSNVFITVLFYNIKDLSKLKFDSNILNLKSISWSTCFKIKYFYNYKYHIN